MKTIRFKQKKGRPNWREPRDYDSLNDMDLSQWAWEFLKRNPRYIKSWERLTSKLTEKQKREAPCFWLCGKPVSPELLDASQWGLPYGYLNPDPTIEYRNIPFIPLGGKIHVELISGNPKGLTVLGLPDYETGDATFGFNFNQPIIPQIEAAKKELLKLQRESKEKGKEVRKTFKPRRDEWILLLRILDATAAGVKDKEIASVLFPDERSLDSSAGLKKVFDKRKQAMRYVNKDYRSIPYSEI